MFTKYWRTYPWFLQLFLFVMLMMVIMILGSLVIQKVLPALTGVTVAAIQKITPASSDAVKRAALLSQITGSLSLFVLPCLLFAYLTHPRPFRYLGLQQPGKNIQWLLVAGTMVGFLIVSLFLENIIIAHVHLPKSLQEAQDMNNNQMTGMLSLKSTGGFILMFITMAILPAVGEELMFRSVLLRFAHSRMKKMWPPVLLTAFFFMLMHSNPLGMPFIFLAGMLLGLIYWYTGSVWCSIFAHFLYNGIQTVFSYQVNNNSAVKASAATETFPAYVVIAGALLLAGSFYGLVKNKTPLPPNWSDDYYGEARPSANQPV